MKSTASLLVSLLATTALAQPHRQHKARHQHKQRDIDVVWVTETEMVTEVIGVTTTIWVSPGYVAPSEPTTTSELSTTASAAQFFQGASLSSSTTSVVAAPVQSTSSSSVYVAPVETPAVVATTSSPAVVAAPAATSSTLVTVASSTPVASTAASSGSSSSSSEPCYGASDACEGDITYYTAGLGACGTTNDGDTQSVVALPYELMGTQSNGNPYCGKTITVTLNGVSTTALVVDKCMGCTGYSIDLSVKAFSDLTPDYVTIGRTTASWYFND